mmetsp:Transcript_28679/g.66130  ORF Transcript_28679/g.66130 Transcript_28679/m.66130 type:complete len:297 (+) Transcript_28679:191-1081(+)
MRASSGVAAAATINGMNSNLGYARSRRICCTIARIFWPSSLMLAWSRCRSRSATCSGVDTPNRSSKVSGCTSRQIYKCSATPLSMRYNLSEISLSNEHAMLLGMCTLSPIPVDRPARSGVGHTRKTLGYTMGAVVHIGRPRICTNPATFSSTRTSVPERKATIFRMQLTYKGSIFRDSGRMSCPGEVVDAQFMRYAWSMSTHALVSLSLNPGSPVRIDVVACFISKFVTTSTSQKRNTWLNDEVTGNWNVCTRINLRPFLSVWRHAACKYMCFEPSNRSRCCKVKVQTPSTDSLAT